MAYLCRVRHNSKAKRRICGDGGITIDDDPAIPKRENPDIRAGALAFSGEPGFASYASSPAIQGKSNESLLQPPYIGNTSREIIP
jgi:hypothetical protein